MVRGLWEGRTQGLTKVFSGQRKGGRTLHLAWHGMERRYDSGRDAATGGPVLLDSTYGCLALVISGLSGRSWA